MYFFTNYQSLCKEHGKSATGVALELGFSRASVSKWKNGSVPNADILSAIADYFDVSVDYLLGNTEIRNPVNNQSPDDIAKVALFGGDREVTEEMWNEVKDYVEYIKQKHFKP